MIGALLCLLASVFLKAQDSGNRTTPPLVRKEGKHDVLLEIKGTDSVWRRRFRDAAELRR